MQFLADMTFLSFYSVFFTPPHISEDTDFSGQAKLNLT